MKNHLRKITRWILAALVLSAAAAAGGHGPAAQETATRPPGPAGWELTVLLPLPADVPGSGGLRLYAVDELFAVSADFFLFWGRLDPQKDEFGLFSYRAGTWALLFRDGKAAVPPFLQGPPEKVCVKKEPVFSAPTKIVAGPDRFFIMTQEKLYSWDGAALRKVWGALADDPGRLQDKYGRVFDVSADRTGRLLLELSSHSSSGLMFCDAERLLQPLTPKSPLPAAAGGTISKCGRAVLTADGTLFVHLEYKDASGKKGEGIFRRSGADFEKLLAVGDPHPKDGAEVIRDLRLDDAFSRDRYLPVCDSRLYIVDGDRWNGYGKGAGYTITTPRFPKSNPDLFAYVEHYRTPGTLQQYGDTEYTRWVFVDLVKGDDLFVNPPLPGADVVRWNYFDEDFSGVLVWDKHKPEKWAFLDFRDLRRGYTQPPAVVAESGKSFTVGQLKAMVAPGRGLIALADGLYALRKGD